jgi:hypothetical protein
LRLLLKTPVSIKHRGTGTRVEYRRPSEETQPVEEKKPDWVALDGQMSVAWKFFFDPLVRVS